MDELTLDQAIEAEILGTLAEYKARAADGKLTVDDLWAVAAEAFSGVVTIGRLFFDDEDLRPALIAAVERSYDRWIDPLDLPGPDSLLDPMLRSIAREVVGRIYDRLAAA